MSGVRRQLLTWMVFAAGLLLACSACGYLVRAMNPRPSRYSHSSGIYVAPPAPQVARADLVNRAPPVFGPSRTPTPTDTTEFATLFDSLAAAARAGDGAGYAALWDCDRFAEEVWVQVAKWTGFVPTEQRVRATAREARESVANRGREPGQAFRSDRTELLRVARSRDGREALIVARHTVAEDGVPTVYGVRWWLVRAPGGAWKAYDRDVPRSRLRGSLRLAGFEWQGLVGTAGLGGVAPAVPPDAGPTQTPIEAVAEALELPLDGSMFELELALSACRGANLPPPWAAARAVARANLHIQKGEPNKAMAELDKAHEFDPTFPLTRLVRTVAANRLGDHKTALQNAAIYRGAVGPDAEAVLQIGFALEATERSTPAMREYRAALKEFPGHNSLYPALARTLPAGQKREAGELAAKGPRPTEHLDAILLTPESDDVALADEVVAGFLAARPDDPRGLTAAAVVRVRQGKGPEAAALLRTAREATADEKRGPMRLAYADEVLRHRVPVAGYDAVPRADRSAVFRRLASALQTRGPQLELIAAHRAAAPTDPWGAFWLAELFASRGRPEPAEELLAAAMTELPKPARTARKTQSDQPPFHTLSGDEETWDQFRTLRAMYLLELGRWKDAYRELPPAVDTFDQLAFSLDEAGDAAGLTELVEMHRKAVPGDAEVIFWQGQVYWLRKEMEKAVGLFAEYRTVAGAVAVQKWRADEGRVRGLVRLGRVGEARQLLQGSDAVVMALPLQAVVAAAAGDAEGLEGVLAYWTERGGGPREFYADPDLGPLLRGDRFAELRAKYPPP